MVILFVGPLPPPVHGFSVINAAMLNRFRVAGCVSVFDRAPPPRDGVIRRAALGLRLWLSFVAAALRAPPGSWLYIALSGGLGQLKDLPYVLVARLLRRPAMAHHHSFAYVRERPWHARLLLGLLRGQRHLALCDCMARQLADGYRIPLAHVQVLSNAAFLTDPGSPLPASAEPGVALRMGFLSNITAEKGIWAFLEVGDRMVRQGVPLTALVAGPVAADIQARFAQELAARPWCVHLGAVYGAEKAAFFSRIDVLVFPTFYANEAEPVTVLEAMATGVPVLANARGCLANLVPAEAGAVLEGDADFVRKATERLQAWWAEGPDGWSQRRAAARGTFDALRLEHGRRLKELVDTMVRP